MMTRSRTPAPSEEPTSPSACASGRTAIPGSSRRSPDRDATSVYPDEGRCTCPDHEVRQVRCKHLFAVEYTIKRETLPDGSETVTQAVRVTYRQEWSVYNKAQTHEHERFLPLLRELCDGIEQPEQRMGRPRLPLSDVVFALGVKTYSTLSGATG